MVFIWFRLCNDSANIVPNHRFGYQIIAANGSAIGQAYRNDPVDHYSEGSSL
jgi:hypothetical protein